MPLAPVPSVIPSWEPQEHVGWQHAGWGHVGQGHAGWQHVGHSCHHACHLVVMENICGDHLNWQWVQGLALGLRVP
jgi:hypothetical protein